MNKMIKWILIIFAVFVFFGIFGQTSDQQTKPADQQQQDNVNTTMQQTSETVKEVSENNLINEDTNNKKYALPEQTSSAPAQNDNLTVHFIDVGQGDSIFIEYAGKNMLIDAGEANMGSTVSAFLKEKGISSLDYVVATHPHADHIGGLLIILSEYPVGQFIDSGYPHTSQTYEEMLTAIDTKNIPFHVAQRGETIDLAPGIEIQVLNPGKEQSEDLNENSVVLKIIDKDVSFLLMGDAGLETEANIMAAGYNVDADILKVGHHASTSGSGKSFISAVSPRISVIEVGEDNDYGHPHAETLQKLQSTSTVYRTDYNGTITITTDGSTYTVTTKKIASGKTSTTSTFTTKDTTGESEKTIISPTSDNTVITPAQTTNSDKDVAITYLNLKNEYVTIKNSGSSSVDFTGWKIKDEDNKHTYTFPSFQLDAGVTVTLYTGEGSDSGAELYWGSGSPIWNNDGDIAFLYNSEGKIMNSLRG